MLKYYTLLCIFVAMFFAGCTNHQSGLTDKPIEGNVISEISFPNNSKRIMIPVSFKGKEYQFVLDTGATNTAFDISLKDQLGWRRGSSKGRVADGKRIDIDFFGLSHAHFGGLCKKHKTVAVMDLSYLSRITGRKVDGIVGLDILKDHIVRLDFEKNVVSFLRSINDSEFSGCEADLSFKKKLAYINVKVDNIPVRFMIDTGFTNSGFWGLLEPAVIEQLDVVGIGQGDQASTVAAPMDFNQRKTVVANLSIGRVEYENEMFVEHRQSILGLGFFSRHIVTFDFPNKKVYLENIANSDNSSDVSLSISGFDFTLIKRNNNIVVESIDANGLGYKKGIRKDDVILKVNNYDVSAYSLPQFANSLTSLLKELAKEQDLDRFDLTIKRNGETHIINFLG